MAHTWRYSDVGCMIASVVLVVLASGLAQRLSAQSIREFTLPGYTGMPYGTGGNWCIAAIDIDSDNDLDLVVGRSFQPMQVYLNDGHAGFQRLPDTASWQAPGGSYDLLPVDINHDGRVDLIVSRGPDDGTESGSACSLMPGHDQILLNTGRGGFVEASNNLPLGPQLLNGVDFTCQRVQRRDTINFSMGIAAGDFNKDHIPDLVIANGGLRLFPWPGLMKSNLFYLGPMADLLHENIYLGRPDEGGDGVPDFLDLTETSRIATAEDISTDVVVADFNGDSWDDIFVSNYYLYNDVGSLYKVDDYLSRVYINYGDGTSRFAYDSTRFPRAFLGSTSAAAGDVVPVVRGLPAAPGCRSPGSVWTGAATVPGAVC